jgi:hypothetical protein
MADRLFGKWDPNSSAKWRWWPHLAPSASRPTTRRQGRWSDVFAAGTLDAPHIFGQEGILPEVVDFYRPHARTSWSILYLFRSRNAGATWQFFRRIPVPAASLSQYLDAQHWVFASTKATWWTSDGGANWAHGAAHVPGKQQLSAVTFTDLKHGWAIADLYRQDDGPDVGETPLQTNDGGHIWSTVRIPVNSG